MTETEVSATNFISECIGYQYDGTCEHTEKSTSAIGLTHEKYEQEENDWVDKSILAKSRKKRDISPHVHEEKKCHLIGPLEHTLKSDNRRTRNTVIYRRRSCTIPDTHLPTKSKYCEKYLPKNIPNQETSCEHESSWEDKYFANLPESDIPKSNYLPEKYKGYEKFRVIPESIDESCERSSCTDADSNQCQYVDTYTRVYFVKMRTIFFSPHIPYCDHDDDCEKDFFCKSHHLYIETLCACDRDNNRPWEKSCEKKHEESPYFL